MPYDYKIVPWNMEIKRSTITCPISELKPTELFGVPGSQQHPGVYLKLSVTDATYKNNSVDLGTGRVVFIEEDTQVERIKGVFIENYGN